MNCAIDTQARIPVVFWFAVNNGPIFVTASASDRFFSENACMPVEDEPPSAAVTLAARSPRRAYSQFPGQLLLANQR